MRALWLMMLIWVGGCAKYNYDIVRPESARVRIGRDWQRIAAGPVTYRFVTIDNHLVVQIYNSTKGEMRLLGDRSYVVTPGNQSIPLATQSVAPGTYAKVIMPPLEQIVRPGPSIGVGFGYSTGRVYRHRGYVGPWEDPWDEPAYLVVENPGAYWQWEGETDATLHVVVEHSGGEVLEQTFVFHRVRV